MHILMMIGELMRCGGRAGGGGGWGGGGGGGGGAGEDLVWGGLLCVYVVLCRLVKRYNENIVVFLLIKKCV